MWRHYVYIHRRADTDEPFYVGKGTHRTRQNRQCFERAYAHDSRSERWRRIVAKHGLTVEVAASCMTDLAAQELEKELIAQFGRSDLGRGLLINVTDGGDGHAGILVSPALRQKRSQNATGPRSEAWVTSIRRARKNGGNGGVVCQGDSLPKEWRENIAKAKIGARNPMFGKTGELHPNSRTIIDEASGARFCSVTEAAVSADMKMKTLYNMLSGHRPNNTSMRFV